MFDLGPTPFDARLVAFGIPIRVHPTFWVLAILIGWNPHRMDLVFIWVVCTFVSVLIHELGHAITSEWFGWPSHIVLYFGGGLAFSERYYNNSLGRNILVSFMGPGAGFLLYGLVAGIESTLKANKLLIHEYRFYVCDYLIFMNFWWGMLNLLPVLPLDGGNICASVCQLLRLRDPASVTHSIGAAVAGCMTYYAFKVVEQPFLGMMMLAFCVQNISELQSKR